MCETYLKHTLWERSREGRERKEGEIYNYVLNGLYGFMLHLKLEYRDQASLDCERESRIVKFLVP